MNAVFPVSESQPQPSSEILDNLPPESPIDKRTQTSPHPQGTHKGHNTSNTAPESDNDQLAGE